MNQHSAKRVAKVKLTLTKRTVEALEPANKPWIAWDDKLVGFGCRVQPSGTKSFVINYRAAPRPGPAPGPGTARAGGRRDIEARFHLITEQRGPVPANQTMSFLRWVFRRPCVDHEGLRNPVELWLAGGGRYHRTPRKRISSPAEVLPKWRAGIDAAVRNPVHRDVFLFGLCTVMRRGEIFPLRWERVDLEAGLFRVEETKTGVPLELPITRQLWDILARRRAGGAKFWFHALRNCFITVAERELMLPCSLTKRPGPLDSSGSRRSAWQTGSTS